MYTFLSIIVGLSISLIVICTGSPISVDDYLTLRENAIKAEQSSSFGGKLVLEGDEIAANKCVMSVKLREIDEGYANLSKYLPSRNFRAVVKEMEQLELFKILRLMPKGANLHSHVQSVSSYNYTFEHVIYMPNLYVCIENSTVTNFRFFETPDNTCAWQSMEALRASDADIVIKIEEQLSLPDPNTIYRSDSGWEKFGTMLQVIGGMVIYRPVFEKIVQIALQELYDDNVMYVEFRGPYYFDRLYELDGTLYNPIRAFEIFINVIDEFVKSHPGFIGAKFVHSLNRQLNRTEFEKGVKIFQEIKRAFPNFVIGFDMEFHEDLGHPNVYFIKSLLELVPDTSFYFHAGETNWIGHPVDDNLFDAVLLNSKRIGHGYALLKHPYLLKLVKEKNIAIEVNPISNQVLGFIEDLRNHPAAYYFADNFPVVVSNDDTTFWGSSGLSHDFYEAFVGIMSRKADLRALKQLAINSFDYSALTGDDKKNAFKAWEKSWLKFVKYLAHEYKCE